jgi:hypothetical protein
MSLSPIADGLVRWETPFSENRFPSISIITENQGDVVSLIVAPDGIDKYPKYVVRFENVITLLCYEEAFAFDRGYKKLNRDEGNLCAYRWINSSWLKEYQKGIDILRKKNTGELEHYVVFGGDSNVELIAFGHPKIERIDTKTFLETKQEI